MGFEHFYLWGEGENLSFLILNCTGILRNPRMSIVSLASREVTFDPGTIKHRDLPLQVVKQRGLKSVLIEMPGLKMRMKLTYFCVKKSLDLLNWASPLSTPLQTNSWGYRGKSFTAFPSLIVFVKGVKLLALVS